MAKKEKTFWPGESVRGFWGGDMLLSSVDLIAVKNGLKKVFRGEISKEEDLALYREVCKKWGLKMAVSDKKLLGRHNIYFSLDAKSAKKAKRVDPSFKIIIEKKDFGQALKEVKEFSRLLGYPACCVDRYIENVTHSVTAAQSPIFKEIPPKIDFLMNSFLNGISNHYLSFHLPCSFSCKSTLAYHKKIMACVKKDSPEFYRELVGLLKRPLLIFLDPVGENIYNSWDRRQGFLFDGKAGRGGLFYERARYLRASYPEFGEKERDGAALLSVKKGIAGGNKIVFGREHFSVFKGAKKIFEWRNNEQLAAYFLNFV
ncbi:MAG: DUF483 domain-containing protein [Candidatus Portnoybacteria bacterium]|nr:DUF483 domain-containing protein [Candidatus Portnoybacteria bacterium]MDD4982857.1 DUF483 domain-containing protein [Candidatus Portnoybacteria bacterium]